MHLSDFESHVFRRVSRLHHAAGLSQHYGCAARRRLAWHHQPSIAPTNPRPWVGGANRAYGLMLCSLGSKIYDCLGISRYDNTNPCFAQLGHYFSGGFARFVGIDSRRLLDGKQHSVR